VDVVPVPHVTRLEAAAAPRQQLDAPLTNCEQVSAPRR
jgi:hypothetical protein